MAAFPIDHAARLLRTLIDIEDTVEGRSKVVVDGYGLDIGQLIAVACYGVKASLDRSAPVLGRIQASIDLLHRCLAEGQTIYGVNTGFGGSADVRTMDHQTLQVSLPKFLNSGVLLSSDRGVLSHGDILHDLKSHALPRHVVRATMLVRCNSVMRGHSGVRVAVIDAMMTLLVHDLIPVIPLRGSISASGDLAPLSYIVGALQGNPDIMVSCGHDGKILPADQALSLAGLTPTVLGPKEGLGLLNGTAASAAYASVVLHQAQKLAVLTQILTAMGTEALRGNASNYDPFISSTRPHPGQCEAAANILHFLSGSRLCTHKSDRVAGLAQDRYALRTASQWIGPQLEDLALAESQLTIELNSTTDNPLIDSTAGVIHNGGNFQAAAVTSAMEKTRAAIQMLGKSIYAQSQELVNPLYNNGLPPNLTIEQPSLSFTFKGADVAMSAYMSELAFLANSVASHVQSAEMHNQAVYSLALVSARYTADAAEVLSLMCATYLTELCQALDLRVLRTEFLAAVRPAFMTLTQQLLHSVGHSETIEKLFAALTIEWDKHSNADLAIRASETATAVRFAFLSTLETLPEPTLPTSMNTFALSRTYRDDLAVLLQDIYTTVQSRFETTHTSPTKAYLGRASLEMYTHVRDTLGVELQRDLGSSSSSYSEGTRPVVIEPAAIRGKDSSITAAAITSPTPPLTPSQNTSTNTSSTNKRKLDSEWSFQSSSTTADDQEHDHLASPPPSKRPSIVNDIPSDSPSEKEQTPPRSRHVSTTLGTKISRVYESLVGGDMAVVLARCLEGAGVGAEDS